VNNRFTTFANNKTNCTLARKGTPNRDSYTGRRTGNANQLLYSLFNSRGSGRYFNDITPTRQGPNDNGLYPVTPGFELATVIGSPIMASVITGS